MKEKQQVNRFLTLYLLTLIVVFNTVGQGIIINGNKNQIITPPTQKIDPARYHKIQIIDIKIGSLYSDDRGFQQLLKYYGFSPGSKQFIDVGLNYNFLIKKLNLGFRGDLAGQNIKNKTALWHATWQAAIGYTLIRKQKTILTFNSNYGVQTSTIRFGDSPPDFLAKLNYAHESSKLFQKEFIIGPSLNYYRFFNKMRMDSGFSLGLEAGVNFAPFKSIWKYGYDDENFDFIGEKITDMPQVAKQSYYTTLKFGFWSAK